MELLNNSQTYNITVAVETLQEQIQYTAHSIIGMAVQKRTVTSGRLIARYEKLCKPSTDGN